MVLLDRYRYAISILIQEDQPLEPFRIDRSAFRRIWRLYIFSVSKDCCSILPMRYPGSLQEGAGSGITRWLVFDRGPTTFVFRCVRQDYIPFRRSVSWLFRRYVGSVSFSITIFGSFQSVTRDISDHNDYQSQTTPLYRPNNCACICLVARSFLHLSFHSCMH